MPFVKKNQSNVEDSVIMNPTRLKRIILKKFGCENNRKKKTKNYKLLFVDNLHIAKKVEIFFFFGGTFKKISIVAMFIEGKMG